MVTLTAEEVAYGIKELASRQGFKHDVPAGTPITTGYSHGSQGIFSLCGPDPRVWSTLVGIRSLGTRLPSFRSTLMNPLVNFLTGVTAVSGDEPTTVCDDAPTAGLRKTGTIQSPFGRLQLQTPELEINRLGQRNDRGEPMDFFLQNRAPEGGPLSPSFGGTTAESILNSEIAAKFFELQVGFARKIAPLVYTGNPANNVPLLAYPNAAYAEFNGLERLVNTGYVDAISGTSLPSLNPDVKDFGSQQINSAGDAFVQNMTYLKRYLQWNAESMGIPNVEWKIVMRPSAFWVATDIWPCAYTTVMCTIPGNATQFVDAARQREMSNEMRNGNFLWIDGERFEVILDNYLPETQPVGGVFESDIYFLPFTAMGVPVLYWQYFDEGNEEISAAINRFGMGEGVFSTDDGAYIVWTKRTNLCIQWQAKIQPRLRLDTPFLAGRLNNVRYYPLQHERDANPDGIYYVNGGLTSRSGPSLYQPGAA